jgi:hypothetical protein
MSRKNLPSPPLDKDTYARWLTEKPKVVMGGPLELGVDEDGSKEFHTLEARQFHSEVLPGAWREDLVLFGYTEEFAGFKVWATHDDYDYLLMAHSTHKGKFTAVNGEQYADHPHYHELDYEEAGKGGKFPTRHVVEPPLEPGIEPSALLDAFAGQYHFHSDGQPTRTSRRDTPRPGARQGSLRAWFK